MIIAPTNCYFLLKTEGETAQQMMSEIAPDCAVDIESVILISVDIESDIQASNLMSVAFKNIQSTIDPSQLRVAEEYNPLYVPGLIENVDAALLLEARNDSIRFVGMNGNAFTFKTVEVFDGDTPAITGRIEYRPFDLPAYNEIVQRRETALMN